MPVKHLSTAKIARVVGCHPNTVRLYETWGFLPPVPRSRKGYRLFSEDHLDQMRLARAALNTPWPGRAIRRSAAALVRQSASGDLVCALTAAHHHLALVRSELEQAEAAAQLLEGWVHGAPWHGAPADTLSRPLSIHAAANLLGLTCDRLRNWERSGLVNVPRSPSNRYRQYTQVEIDRLRVIRMLRSAGYSTMAILRMLVQLDRGELQDVRHALDTPREDEDILYAADRWLTTLKSQEERAHQLIQLLEERIQK